MSFPRRDFMKVFGISLGSLLLTRCQLVEKSDNQVTCYVAVPFTPEGPAPTPKSASARSRLRLCWLRFGELAQKTAEDSKTQGTGWEENPTGKRMIADHRAALDEMAAAGEVAAPVAGLIREAYEAAVYHVWRSNAPMTCYDMATADYVPASADNLVNQAEALAGIEDEGTVPPETLEKVRTALEHDPR
jgi:hypothetical protein